MRKTIKTKGFRESLVEIELVLLEVGVPAGPQDSSVRDAGHTGHWAQRVIEPSPVQKLDEIGGQDRVRGTGHC